ncbi:helix-turn-helix domain-containing protein [Puia sp.]|uniref:helix-turn-helix domain-containing protein n=1 Tax=Puia sp. TaxID=2045100 RepID=UPI002F3E2D7E
MVGILRSIILLGAIQGFIVVALLLSAARRDPGSARQNRLLAILILLLAMACLNIYLFETPALMDTPVGNLLSALIPMVIVMPIGPLLYFYVRCIGEPEFRLSRKYRPHFYSVGLDLFPHAAAFVYLLLLIFGLLDAHHNYGFGSFLDYYQQYADIPRWISLSVYLWLAVRFLARARKLALGEKKASGEKQVSGVAPGERQASARTSRAASREELAWPRALVRGFTAFAVLWLIFLVPYEIPRYSDKLLARFDWYPLYLPIVFLIYWLGVKGFFISGRKVQAKAAGPRTPPAPEVTEPAVRALKKAMEQDTLWLDPALNLTLLARHCGLTPKTLSAVLNQHLEKTFSEFVNEYRVAAFKHRLLEPASRELTIAGLAYECGFNSLPTFQRAFKALTGVTPKEYWQKNGFPLDRMPSGQEKA